MTLKRRYLISGAVLAACVCIALGVLAMLPSRPGVTKANFDRIEKGMTKPEVQALLGRASVQVIAMGSGRGFWATEAWRADDQAQASVVFVWRMGDDVEKVSSMTWRESTETPIDKLLRWLHLPK